MEITVAVLADAANVAAGDKLNIMGAFDGILAHTFPAVHPFMALAVRFRLEYEDGGRTHDLTVTMKDDDGGEGGKAEARMTVVAIPSGEFASVNHILNFAGIVFSKPGRFYFEIAWDGQVKATVPLMVKQAQESA